MAEEGWINPFAHSYELDVLGDLSLATRVLEMLAFSSEWVHRRIEKVEILAESTNRRRVSLDFTVPYTALLNDPHANDELALIPVDLLAKEPLRRFSISDGNGTPIPLLTRRQNGHLAWKGLVGLATDALGQVGRDMPTWMHEPLRVIAQEHAELGLTELGVLQRWAAQDPHVSDLFRDSRTVCTPGFIDTASMLCSNFILAAVVRASPGDRLLIKYELEESLGRPGDDERDWKRRFAEALSWHPTTRRFKVPAFTDCESFHFEAESPDGVEMLDIVLADEAPERAGDPRWSLGYRWLKDKSPRLAYLAVSRTSDPDADQDDFQDPWVRIGLRVERPGWLRNVTLSAVAIAAIVTLSYFAVSRSNFSGNGSDPAAVTAALLGVVSVSLVRVGEHGFTSRLLRPLRLLAMTSASIPFIGAWLLAFEEPGQRRATLWAALVALAWVLATGLVLVALRRPPSPEREDASPLSAPGAIIVNNEEASVGYEERK